MNIFESLENLNVSEKCFEDILRVIENLLNEDIETLIKKKYGEPEYAPPYYSPANKSAQLLGKVIQARNTEIEQAAERENSYPAKIWGKRNKRNRDVATLKKSTSK